jgi:hypothetical protein
MEQFILKLANSNVTFFTFNLLQLILLIVIVFLLVKIVEIKNHGIALQIRGKSPDGKRPDTLIVDDNCTSNFPTYPNIFEE